MAIIDPNSIPLFFEISGKLHKPLDVNPLKPNSRANAYPLLKPGIYRITRRAGKRTIFWCDFYEVIDNPTPGRLAQRAKYADGVDAWKNLTWEQKKVYNKKSAGKHMSGYNVFMKEYLLNH